MLNKIFFKYFQTLNLEKKKRWKKEKNKEKIRKSLICYNTSFHEPNNSNILYPLFLIEKLVIWF